MDSIRFPAPAEVTRIGVTVQKRQTSQVIMFSLTSDGRYDDEFLTNYNNINIIPAIKRIQGVGDVQSPGLKTYSMRIWLKPDVMKQYNLSAVARSEDLLYAYLAEAGRDEAVQPDAKRHQCCVG